MSFLFADKPSGVTTHSSLNERERSNPLVDINDGFVESLSWKLNRNLFVSHRLDRETSGAICFALDPEGAEKLRGKFAAREVKKTYFFLTDKKSKKDIFTHESFIERRGNAIYSEAVGASQSANAKTFFEKIDESHGVSLWMAKPETGRPHQIRLHAKENGISILGDELYQGTPFPALCLHSKEIRFEDAGQGYEYQSPTPRFFEDRSLVEDLNLCRWLHAIERRERLLRSGQLARLITDVEENSATIRWIHTEGDPLRVEQLGSVIHLSWFKDDLPNQSEWRSIELLLKLMNWKEWYLQVRGNRGQSPLDEKFQFSHPPPPQRWHSQESNLKFEFRSDSGLSPGLFLDQRQNRIWVRDHSKGKSVLNLFCYTGGFSVFASAGGALKTVSVDISKTFLEWTKNNFQLNSLDTSPHEFRAMDSREYLAWAKKKGLTFDIVICDPPSFSRSKGNIFKIEKDFEPLLHSLMDVTAVNGRILFSTNFESWDLEDFFSRIQSALRNHKIKFKIERTPSADWDFELPSPKSNFSRNMKSFFLVRT